MRTERGPDIDCPNTISKSWIGIVGILCSVEFFIGMSDVEGGYMYVTSESDSLTLGVLANII